jgi:hypothetical protein
VHLDRRYWDNLHEVKALAAQMLPNMHLTFARDQQVIKLP